MSAVPAMHRRQGHHGHRHCCPFIWVHNKEIFSEYGESFLRAQHIMSPISAHQSSNTSQIKHGRQYTAQSTLTSNGWPAMTHTSVQFHANMLIKNGRNSQGKQTATHCPSLLYKTLLYPRKATHSCSLTSWLVYIPKPDLGMIGLVVADLWMLLPVLAFG